MIITEIEFSIVLPIYNQETQIADLVQTYDANIKKNGLSCEVLLIVNGSKDNSYQTALDVVQNKPNFKVFELKEGGWGRAVKFGIKQSIGKYICYTNSARTGIDDLILILKFAKVNDSFAIKATRIVRDNFLRKLGSTLYNIENRILFQVPVWDINGTPKVVPAKYIKDLEFISDGDVIDAEVVTRLSRNNVRFIEIPVLLTTRIDGKSTTNFKSAFRMYKGALKLKNLLK